MGRIFAAIFFKECIKTRLCLLMLTVATLLCMGWIWLGVRQLFLLDHPEIVWYRVMDLGQIPYGILAVLPVIRACVFCCCQFFPEMRDERLRISLHLPCGIAPLIMAHLLFGLLFLALLSLLDGLLLTWIMGVYFPEEATAIALLTSLPWFLAGFFAYLCTAYALLEPQRRTKLMGAILGVGLCAPLLLTAPPGALAPAVPWFAALLPILLLGLLHPAMNFRHRRTS